MPSGHIRRIASITARAVRDEAPARPRPDPRRPGAFGAAHADPADAYAGVPILQEPRWHNEIAAYFWLGGISSGAYLLGALADLAGERWRPLARTAHVVAFAAMVPCAPLLIDDLGRPSRFHHMLRIFKPSSPMNLGTWTLVAHSGFSTLLAAQALAERDRLPVAGPLARRLPPRALGAAGALPAMTLGGYTGVLLGTTSVPVWSRSPVLGGLFMSSAIASGTSAVALASILTGSDTQAEHAVLGSIGIAAGVTELGLAGGYLATSGTAAAPLRTGLDGALLLGAVAAAATALALELAGTRAHGRRRTLSAVAAGASLAGGALLRWAVIRAGHASALDRDANLAAMRATPDNPGWGPPALS
jgi:formate-dependent nitrite reductase membrane component NrfD